MIQPKTVFLQNGKEVDDDLKARAAHKMAERLEQGRPVVIGTMEACDPGITVFQDGERHLVIKRRSTRQEFLDCAPVENAEQRANLKALSTPFYYELELWDRVMQLRDGERYGVRIRRVTQ